MSEDFVKKYFEEVTLISKMIDRGTIEQIVADLKFTKKAFGRVYVIGLGGSAANASHMVNDLRKLCAIKAYCPTDNMSEFSARVNDEGINSFFVNYLQQEQLTENDMVFILSVGGGCRIRGVSVSICNAIDYVYASNAVVCGIIGKKDGYLGSLKNAGVVIIPEIEPSRVTPHSEAFQAVVWHCIVSHPDLQENKTTW